ncbi:cytochrome oxidase assembly [Luminiphilus syltensis NOR5-1B]|uniref:Cytochrome oxidase assembly n=1 Tax=Luminiphilus syltensis NOR5-1B TaxID=565045 RepID=B8KRU4_9GAMM|nr:COX15/CtaA family protein [Luminiphilus syltensis]EED34254.1 cytochrome oxidase assembly [Luminiphilus syltensis NOR5-1B]
MLQTADTNDRWVARWLILCAAVIFGMILLGGVTRLTDSGLSMVDWQPIMGIVPPLNAADWQAAFDAYKQYPEYQKINREMTLEGFKPIFMYEYLHRVLGRLIGLLFFLPLVFFAFRGMVRPGLLPRLLLLLFLGGCQGLLGWYMVQSGLVDRPDVSQYRLTAHLGLAVLIYAYMIWLILGLVSPHRMAMSQPPRWPLALVALVYLMILSGGFVAGTDAGYSYPTWPLMGQHFFPPTLYAEGMVSAFEQVTTIHFNHRMLAYVVAAVLLAVGVMSWRGAADGRLRLAVVVMLLAVTGQVVLGISTVLSQVHVPIAAAHQSGAILLLTTVLFFAYTARTRSV